MANHSKDKIAYPILSYKNKADLFPINYGILYEFSSIFMTDINCNFFKMCLRLNPFNA